MTVILWFVVFKPSDADVVITISPNSFSKNDNVNFDPSIDVDILFVSDEIAL